MAATMSSILADVETKASCRACRAKRTNPLPFIADAKNEQAFDLPFRLTSQSTRHCLRVCSRSTM